MDTSIGSGDSRGYTEHSVESRVFRVVDSPVRSFLEVPISGDLTFDSIELQYLSCDSPKTGRATGCFAALVHTPAGVDLYLDPEVGLDREWFDHDPAYANLERSGFHLTPVTVDRWEIAADRVDVDATFQLEDGRTVSFRVDQERASDRVLRQFIPTPAIQNLSLLRFLQVDGFGLLRRRSRVEVAIDGKMLTPATFALPLAGKRRYAARYAARCFVVGLNPHGEHQLDGEPSNALGWTFEPGLVDRVAVGGESGDSYDGLTEGTVTFRMDIGQVTTARYRYQTTSQGHKISLTHVEQEWKPSRRNLQLWVLALLRRLRRRDLTWQWSGLVHSAVPPAAGILTQSEWTSGHG